MVQRGQSPNPFHCEGGKNPLSTTSYTMDVFEFLMALFGSLYLYARYIYFAYFHILLQLQFGFSPKNMNEVNTPNYRRLSMLRSNVHVFDESFVKLIELPAAQIRVASLILCLAKNRNNAQFHRWCGYGCVYVQNRGFGILLYSALVCSISSSISSTNNNNGNS